MSQPVSEPVISASDLSKRYGDVTAVDGISLHIERGEVVGFLGPNGAGKTTTLRILAGFIPPTSGWARIAGHDVLRAPRAAKKQVGYLPERPPLYPEMTARDYLRFVARIKGLSRKRAREEVERVIAQTDIAQVAARLIAGLSRGFQQRVGLAQALLGEPPVLLLDEPTVGLDPNQIQFVRNLIRTLARERTVLLSTHFLYEVEEVCSRVLILREGRVVADAPLAELARGHGFVERVAVGIDSADAAQLAEARRIIGEVPGIHTVDPDPARPGRFLAACAEGVAPGAEIARRLVQARLPLSELTPLRPRLEEVYLQLTGQAPAVETRGARAA
jgi:ABC-2 type transport system ATP-binding protein